MKKVLFVCLGNICRSPMGEAAFQNLIDINGRQSDVFIDSAGTSAFHIGEKADKRMRETAMRLGNIELLSKARQVKEEDFHEFDWIVAMDKANLQALKSMEPKDGISKLVLMRHYDPIKESQDVPDPYYGGDEGFENVYKIITRSCEKFYEEVFTD